MKITSQNKDNAIKEKTTPPPQTIRNSRKRKQRVNEYVKGLLPSTVSTKVDVRIDRNVRKAFVLPTNEDELYHSDQTEYDRRKCREIVNNTDEDYIMAITGQAAPLEDTCLENQYTADLAQQYGLALHETLHILKTATAKTNQLIENQINDEYKQVLQRLNNTVEDGGIENELKTGDEFSSRAAARIRFVRDLQAYTPKELYQENGENPITFGFSKALDTVFYEVFIFDSEITDALLDPTDTRISFDSNETEQTIRTIYPDIQRARDDIFSYRGDDTKYRISREASIKRTQRLIDLWVEDIKPELSTDQQQEANDQSNNEQGQTTQPQQGPQPQKESQPQQGSQDTNQKNTTAQESDPSQIPNSDSPTVEINPEEMDSNELQNPSEQPDIEDDPTISNESIEDIAEPQQSEAESDQENKQGDEHSRGSQPSQNLPSENEKVQSDNDQSEGKEDKDREASNSTQEKVSETQDNNSTDQPEDGQSNVSTGDRPTNTDQDQNPPSDKSKSSGSQEGEQEQVTRPGDETTSQSGKGRDTDNSDTADQKPASTTDSKDTDTAKNSKETPDDRQNINETANQSSQNDKTTEQGSSTPTEGQVNLSDFTNDDGQSPRASDAHSDNQDPSKQPTNECQEQSSISSNDEDRDNPNQQAESLDNNQTKNNKTSQNEDSEKADPADLTDQQPSQSGSPDTPNLDNTTPGQSTTNIEKEHQNSSEQDSQNNHSQSEIETTPPHSKSEVTPEDYTPDNQIAESEVTEQSINGDSLKKDLDALTSGNGAGEATLDKIEILPEPNTNATEDWSTIKEESKTVTQRLAKQLEQSRRSTTRRELTAGTKVDADTAYRLNHGDTRTFKREQKGDKKKYTMIVILDRSGSMGSRYNQSVANTKIHTAVQAVTRFAAACEELEINVAVIDFLNNKCRYVKTPSTDTKKSLDRLLSTKTGGGTPLEDALEIAGDIAQGESEETLIIPITDDLAPNVEAVSNVIEDINSPICTLTIATDRSPDNPPEKAEKLADKYTQSKYVFNESKLNDRLDQFASLIGYF